MENNLQRVAILLNNVAVELLLDNLPMKAVTTLRDAMELMKYVATGTQPHLSILSCQELLNQAQARRFQGNADDDYDDWTCQSAGHSFTPIAIQDLDDCPVGVVSCVTVFNYGLALECVNAADAAVYHIFLLASTLLETCATEEIEFLGVHVIGKLMQVSQRLGLEEEYMRYRLSYIRIMNRKEEQESMVCSGATLAPAA